MQKQIGKDTEFDELVRDPKAFGLPTFQEYCKNPDSWTPKSNLWEILDNGPRALLKDKIRKVKFKVNGFTAKSAEAAQNMCEEFGVENSRALTIDDNRIDWGIECVPLGGGKIDLLSWITIKPQQNLIVGV